MIVALALVGLLGAAPPSTPVADAAMRGDANAVKSLLEQGADVNAPQGDGMTALHWAALKNRSGTNVRELFPKIYERQIQKHLNYVGLRREVVNGPHGPLYSLLYASKHERGLEFWDKIAKKELGGQTRMF